MLKYSAISFLCFLVEKDREFVTLDKDLDERWPKMKDIKDALALIETGQVDEAYELLQHKLRSATDDEKFVIVELYEDWGFIEDAIKLLENLLERYPKEGQLLTKLADLYMEVEDDEQAIQLLNQVDKADPFYLHSLLILADSYERDGLFEVAEQKLLEAEALVSDEELFIVHFALAELYLSIGKAQAAIYYYEKVLQQVDELNGVMIHERLAESYSLLGNFEKALYYYDELASHDPNILFKHGFTAYQAKHYHRAIEIWKEVLDIDPYYHPVYYELATVYLENNDIQQANKIAKSGLKYDEFDKRLYYIIGQTSFRLAKLEEAIEALQEAIALDEDYKEAIVLLVEIYEENNQMEEMVEFLEEIKDLGGSDPVYEWKLAIAYQELEQYQKARESFEIAYFHLENDPAFLKDYGYFLIEDGSLEEGVKLLNTYVKKKPDDVETIEFLERIHFSNEDKI